MGFASGSVTFKRYFVGGKKPKQVDEDLLEALTEHAIGHDSTVEPDRTEVGWVTGDHILDTQFDFAKNAVADCLHFALRIDANKAPTDLVRSYQKQNEEAALEASGREFLTKEERRDARDQARSRADREAASGMHRRMKQYPVLWDLARNELYLGATSPAVVDRFVLLFDVTFECSLTTAGAGSLASRWASRAGWSNVLAELRPVTFMDPPEGYEPDFEEPSDDPRRNDFLGTEWLLWLWFTTHAESAAVAGQNGDSVTALFSRSLDLKCAFGLTGTDSIKADEPTRLPESRAAIASGKVPLKAGLHLIKRDEPYVFSIRGDAMHVSGLKLPPVEEADARTIFEERTAQLRHFTETLDELFGAFLKQRLGSDWPTRLAAIRSWMTNSGGPNLRLVLPTDQQATDPVTV